MKININNDDDNLNDLLTCWELFKSRPNRLILYNIYDSEKFLLKINDYLVINEISEYINRTDELILSNKHKFLVKIDKNIYLSYIKIYDIDSALIKDLTFFYKNISDFNDVKSTIEYFSDCELNFDEQHINNDKSLLNTYTLDYKNNEFILDAINFKSSLSDIEKYYNKSTFKNINSLHTKINNSQKGIHILYGETGTGKTSTINFLASNIDKNFIYLPLNSIDYTINNPSFNNALKSLNGSVLIIDNFEAINEISSQNFIINNLLEIVDGYMSDDFNINILIILNEIDVNLLNNKILDSPNLLNIVKFEPLTAKEANNLSQFLSNKKLYSKETRLIDVLKISKKIPNKKIGF